MWIFYRGLKLDHYSENAVEESRKFVISTVINKEFSTRLSINSIAQLRDSVLRAIQTNNRPKVRYLLLLNPFNRLFVVNALM